MKRIIALVCLAALLAVALVSCGPNFDSMKKKLEKEGYLVVMLEGDQLEALGGEAGDVKAALSATKLADGETVSVVEFKNADAAKKAEEEGKAAAELIDGYTCVRKGNTVYAGTEAAVKLVK